MGTSQFIGAGKVRWHYFVYITLFIIGRLLLIIPLFLLASIIFIVGLVFLGLIFHKINSENFGTLAIIIGSSNLIFMIIRFIKNFPIELFNSFSAISGFQHSAIYESEEFGANLPTGTHGFTEETYQGGRIIVHYQIFNIYVWFRIVKIILAAPGNFIADTICILLQIIATIFAAGRYTKYIIILTQANGEPMRSEQIAEILNINELKCKKILLQMEQFGWIVVSQRGFKLNTIMLKTFNPNYRESPICYTSQVSYAQEYNRHQHYLQKKENELNDQRRSEEQKRLTEKFFSITEQID